MAYSVKDCGGVDGGVGGGGISGGGSHQVAQIGRKDRGQALAQRLVLRFDRRRDESAQRAVIDSASGRIAEAHPVGVDYARSLEESHGRSRTGRQGHAVAVGQLAQVRFRRGSSQSAGSAQRRVS